MKPSTNSYKVLRLEDVRAATGLSRSAIYNKGCSSSRYFDASFPARFKIGHRSVGWDAHEVNSWIQARKSEFSASGH